MERKGSVGEVVRRGTGRREEKEKFDWDVKTNLNK